MVTGCERLVADQGSLIKERGGYHGWLSGHDLDNSSSRASRSDAWSGAVAHTKANAMEETNRLFTGGRSGG